MTTLTTTPLAPLLDRLFDEADAAAAETEAAVADLSDDATLAERLLKASFAALLKDLPEFTRNLSEKMLTYALGRGLERFDRPAVRDIVSKMDKSEYRFQVLVREISASLPFQNRRGQLADGGAVRTAAANTRDPK